MGSVWILVITLCTGPFQDGSMTCVRGSAEPPLMPFKTEALCKGFIRFAHTRAPGVYQRLECIEIPYTLNQGKVLG